MEDTEVYQEEQPKPKLKVKEFAAKIKAKYPQYKDIDDTELTNKIIAKYPDYKEQVDFSVEKKSPAEPSNVGQKPLANGLSTTPTVEEVPVQQQEVKDPITASLEAEQKKAATKEIPVIGGSFDMGTTVTNAPDTELNKQGEEISKGLKETYGVDSKHIASLFQDLPPEILNDPNHLAQYNELLRTQPTVLETQLAHDKWKPEIMAKASPEEQQFLNSIAAPGSYQDKRNAVKNAVPIIRKYSDNPDKSQKHFSEEASLIYGANLANNPTQFDNTPEAKNLGLSSNQIGAYQFLQDTNPQQAEQYKALFIDKDKIAPDDYQLQYGLEEKGLKLEQLGLSLKQNAANYDKERIGNGIKQLQNEEYLYGLSDAKKNELAQLQQEAEKNKSVFANIESEKQNIVSGTKYLRTQRHEADEFATELLGQQDNFGEWAYNEAGKAISNTVTGTVDFATAPFRSDENNYIRQAQLLGNRAMDEQIAGLPQSKQTTISWKPAIDKDLSDQIEAIKKDGSLDDSEKHEKVVQLLMANPDKHRKLQMDGGETNINLSSLLHGVTQLAVNLAPFIAITAATGVGAAPSAVGRFATEFGAAAATGFNDAYTEAIKNGDANPYAKAMRVTAINSAAMAGAGTASEIRAMISKAKNPAIDQMIAKLSDREVMAALRSEPASFSLLKKVYNLTAPMGEKVAENLRGAAKIVGFTTAGQAANDAISGELKPIEDYVKSAGIELLKFGIFGTLTSALTKGATKPSDMNKLALYEAAKSPEAYLKALDEKIVDKTISKEDAAQVKSNIEAAQKVMENVPMVDAKGKALPDAAKRDLLFLKLQEQDIDNVLKKDIPQELADKVAKRLEGIHEKMDAIYKGTFLAPVIKKPIEPKKEETPIPEPTPQEAVAPSVPEIEKVEAQPPSKETVSDVGVEVKYYHGTNDAENIRKSGFKTNGEGSSFVGDNYVEGVYLSKSKKPYEEGQQMEDVAEVLHVSVKDLNIKKVDGLQGVVDLRKEAGIGETEENASQKLTEYLKKEGFDGLDIGEETVIFDPKNVTIKDESKPTTTEANEPIQNDEGETFYTGRGKKFDDLQQTRGDFIFFSKDPKVSEWYGGDESNVSEAKLDTSKFLDLSTQEKKAQFVKEHFTDEDIHELYQNIKKDAFDKYSRSVKKTYEQQEKELLDKYRERLQENRFSGDGKEQKFLLKKIKDKGYTGVKLLDAHFGKHDMSYVVIDKSVINKPKEKTNEPTSGEINEPIPTNTKQPKGKGAEESLQPSPESTGNGKPKEAIPVLENKKDLGTKARELAKELREGKKNMLPDFMRANLPKGTKTGGLTANEAFAKALETFADIHDATKDFAKAVEVGFQHIKDYFDENKIPYNEKELKEGFAKELGGDGKEPIEPMDVENDLGNAGRRFTQQMLRTEDLTPEAKERVAKTLEYVEQTNAMSEAEATRIIREVGAEEAFKLITDRNNNVNGAVRTTIGQVLIKSYNELARTAPNETVKNEYLDKTIDVATFVTEKLATDAGQSIQAFSMWQRLSPEAQLRAEIKDKAKQGRAQKQSIKKSVDKISTDLQKANEEAANELTEKGKIKKATQRAESRLAKIGQDKVAKAKAAREKILKKYRGEKGGSLYSGIGLTKEGIEFVASTIKTYLDEGIGRVEIIADKVLQHLKEVSGKPPTTGVISQVEAMAKEHLQKHNDTKIGFELKNLESEVNKIVKEHYTVRGDAKKTLTDKFIEKLGLEKSEVEQLAKEIQIEFDAIATRKKQALLDREIRRLNKIKDKVGGKKVERKQIQDEIIKFSNLGAFDSGQLLDVIGERLGIGKITPEEAAKIIELSEKIQNAPEGSPKRNATEELLKYRANLKGTNWGEVAQGVWYAEVLSGYATHIRNLVSTFYNTMAFATQEAVSNPRSIPYLMYGIGKGLGKGVVEAAHTVRTGQTPIHISKIEVPDVLERTTFKGGLLNPYNYLKYVGRLMKAEDVLLFQGLKEMRATQLAYREAAKMGNKNPFSKEVFHKVNELLLNTKERAAEADAQIEAEGITSRIEKMRRKYELMESSRPIEMTDEAYGFAAKGTFNHNTEGTLGALSDAVSGFLDNSLQIGGTKPLRFLIPFTRIITNVANNTLDFSPIGMVRAAVGKRGLLASEASGKRIEMTPEERRQTTIRASLGIATMAAAYALSKNGTIQITGAGPSDIKKRLQLVEEGWQPFSIKIGDKFYSYKLTPMVFGLGIIGSIRDHEEYDKDADEQTLSDRTTLALWDGIKTVGDMTWIGSAAPLMGALSENNPNKGASILGRTIENSAKSFLIPNAYTQGRQKIEQIFQMPQKETNNAWQLLIKDIPFARNAMNDRINALGDPVVKDVDILASSQNLDPVWKYLFEKKGWVAPVNKNTLIVFDDNIGEERPATQDEFYEFSKLRGQKIKQKIQDFIDGKTEMSSSANQFEKNKSAEEVTSGELNKWLSEISTKATDETKKELFELPAKKRPLKVFMQQK